MEKIVSKNKQILYAFSAFGPNLLNIFVAFHLLNAFSTEGFINDSSNWTFYNKTIVVLVAFGVIITIAKIIDGFIDIPLAKLSDSIKSKWGRRKTSMLIGFIPMTLSYIGLCFPLSSNENSILNTLFSGLLLIIFLVSYTMCLINYYATIPEITSDLESRKRISSWKAFFDVITYSVAFALVPVFIGFSINIRYIALASLPLMFTFIIPFFLLKEKSNKDIDLSNEEIIIRDENNQKMASLVKEVITNKTFMKWMLVFSFFFFGLQLFLAAQSGMASGALGLDGMQTAILNTAAFAPVPLTLWIYNKVFKKVGFRFAFRTAIFAFILALCCFALAYVKFIPQTYIRLLIGCLGGIIGSYGIGAFFYSPYIVISEIAANEEKTTKKNRGSMFFAVQGLINAVVSALSTGLVWWGLKAIFKETDISSNLVNSSYAMIFVVILFCIISFVLSFLLKPDFDELFQISVPNKEESMDLKEIE